MNFLKLRAEEKMTFENIFFKHTASLLLASAAGGQCQLGGTVTLKMHQFLPANASELVLDVWAEQVEKDSGGRIKIDHYPSMQLGGRPPELVDQVINGVADIIWTVVGIRRRPQPKCLNCPL